MCYSGACPHELWSGECGRKKGDLCPESFETPIDYEEALRTKDNELLEEE